MGDATLHDDLAPVFRALADDGRRALLDALVEHDGQTVGELCEVLPGMTRFGVMKHLAVLEEAHLVVTERAGRSKLHHLNPVPIREIHDRWICRFTEPFRRRAPRPARPIRGSLTMAAGAHLYEIFIRASREAVWEALTGPDHTVRYFHATRIDSSFRAGAKWRLVRADDDSDAVEGRVETFDPPHRLVLTWRVLYDAAMRAEPPSRVEWTLTPANEDGSVTRVTLRHSDLALSPRTWEHVRLGWVGVIDSLKTYLETGEPLPDIDATTGELDGDDVEGQWHRAEAVAANNAVWELLDGRALGPAEVDELLERAYAAAYHWRRARGATVVNRARASYLLSRAHATCGHGELALHHAAQCSEVVGRVPDDVADFDHAYAYEARARALACLDRLDEAREVRRRAAAVRIGDDQDRAIFEADLAAGPWFGLDQ